MYRLFLILIPTLLLFINCGENTKEDEQSNIPKSEIPKIEQEKVQPIILNSEKNGVFLAIAYFDENNNLEKIERYYNGKLLNY